MKPATSKRIVKETRNWLDLPRDVVIHIFIKLGTINVLYTSQRVCSLWRKISKEPQLFLCVDMRFHKHVFHQRDYSLQYAKMTKEALNRCSSGELAEFSMDSFGTDELLELAIAKSKSRSSLRYLRLVNTYNISQEAFIKIAATNPMLEKIDLPVCRFDAKTIATVGRSCQHLKSFRMASLIITQGESRFITYGCDKDECAYAIANNMPGLRCLHLIGNKMDNKCLQAILDKCPHLECLDLRRCFRIDLKGDLLLKNCVEKIRNLRLPTDHTDEYKFQVDDDYRDPFDN